MEHSQKRRDFLKTLGVGAAASTLAFKAPYVFAKNKVTLRVMGTHVTLQEELKQRAMRELGINIEFLPMGSAAVCKKQQQTLVLLICMSNGLTLLIFCGTQMPFRQSRLIDSFIGMK